MTKAKVLTEIYYDQCIPKHWDFFPDSCASLDYFAANFCLFCMLSSWPFPIVLKVSQIFSHQVVSLLHWYQSFLRLQMKSFFLKINVFLMAYVTEVQFTGCIVLPRVWVGKWIVECTHRRMFIDDFRLSKIFFFPIQKPYTKKLVRKILIRFKESRILIRVPSFLTVYFWCHQIDACY